MSFKKHNFSKPKLKKEKITRVQNFLVNINSEVDFNEILKEAENNNLSNILKFLNNYKNDWDDNEGLCLHLDICQNGDYVNNIDKLGLYLKLYCCNLSEDFKYTTVSKERFIDIISNYKNDQDFNNYLNSKKKYLNKLINYYDYLKIGSLVVTDIELDYKFYRNDSFKMKKIEGYYICNDKWYLKTSAGMTDFHRLYPKEILKKESEYYEHLKKFF